MSAAVTAWAIEALVASTLLMVGVLLVRAPVRRLFGPQVAYALWALPVLRLVLPPMPQGWQTIATPITRAGETIAVYVIQPVTSATVTATAASVPQYPSFGLIIGAAWGAGAAAFLVWHFVQHSRFCARMLGTAERLDDQDGVRVIASAAAPGPLAFGILRRYVAFPHDFDDRYDADERALALAHEIGHHQRGDLIANWAALVVLSLHWFNPVAWRAFRSFRADQELANDARVLAGRSAVDRHIYACAIVKAAHGGAVSAACHLHTITDLKGRLRMLTTSRTSRRRVLAGTAAVALLSVAGLGLTISGTRAAATVTHRIETATGLSLQAPPAPSSPAPSTPPAFAVPPTPPIPSASGNARRVVVVKNGRTAVYEGAAADRYIAAHPVPMPPVPPRPQFGPGPVSVPAAPAFPMPPVPVVSGQCGPDAGRRSFTMTRREGNATVTIICNDRIAAAARAGQMTEADGQAIGRQATTAALSSLQATRASMSANASIPPADRAEALADIDASIADLHREIADMRRD